MDESELRTLLSRMHSASFGWALACCRNREEAEEVLQSVYAKLLGKPSAYDGRAEFRTWLFTVIRNAATDHRRSLWWSRSKRSAEVTLTEFAASSGRQSHDFFDDELLLVRGALDRLPERQREIAHLVFYEDLPISEAAEVMGVSVGTARQHYARAKDALRTLLRSLEPVQ